MLSDRICFYRPHLKTRRGAAMPTTLISLRVIVSFLLLSAVGRVEAGALPTSSSWGQPTCDVSKNDISLKDRLRQGSYSSQNIPQESYRDLLEKHKSQLESCRKQTFPQTQALWLRLYPNDARAGVLEDVLDKIVNRGYNQVFVEVFYDGRILLPVADNPTPWRSVTEEAVKSGAIAPNYDLWAEVVRKGKERGLKIYGWAFTLNFGYGYGELSDRTAALARNGVGATTIANSQFDPKSQLVANGQAFYLDAYERDHLFVDPYSLRAQADYASAIAALVKRQPDGMLFDYVRYPITLDNGGNNNLINNVKQLWIYGDSARTALLDSIPDPRTKQLMSIYLDAGKVTPEAIAALDPSAKPNNLARRTKLSEQLLWQLTTEHAYRGVLNFLDRAIATVNQTSNYQAATGAAFFAGGNLQSKNGYDARMQPWDRFPASSQRHPMTYAICADGKCVADEVVKILRASPKQTTVCPVLAGTWGQSFGGHPSLEIQMQAIKAAAPQISCLSHFVYAWLEPESDRQRKAGTAIGF